MHFQRSSSDADDAKNVGIRQMFWLVEFQDNEVGA